MENQVKPQEMQNTEINELLNIAKKWNKYRETVYRNVKKYQQNHKTDQHYIEFCREKSKRFYHQHKEEIQEKRRIKKWQSNNEVFSLMNILY
jgi:hypothetical protein